MHWIHGVAILAVLQYLFFGAAVGRARMRYGVKAPATSGHEQFERVFRVQMNTVEQLVAFLPALFLASLYAPAAVVAGLGLVYLVGRFVYWRAYVVNPAGRSLGFMLTAIPTFVLLAWSLVGVLRQLAAA